MALTPNITGVYSPVTACNVDYFDAHKHINVCASLLDKGCNDVRAGQQQRKPLQSAHIRPSDKVEVRLLEVAASPLPQHKVCG